jgi:uncharacterized protein
MMCLNRVTGIAVLLGLIETVAVLPASAASFDCAKAQAPDERAICKDRTLSELDSEMGGLWYAYRRIPMLMGSNGARHDAADDFLRHRSACASNVACLRQLYHTRIKELQDDIDTAMRTISQEENGAPAARP